MKANVHSVESCGTVDGPGLRFVIFLQGCPLRCLYCHNPDTWNPQGGEEMDVNTLMAEVEAYIPYMKFSNGGVTVSGGEPLLQPDFIEALFKQCKEKGIHTTLDTAGSVIPKNIDNILELTDLVLMDIKQIDPVKHEQLTSLSNKNTLKLARKLDERNIPIWVRYVLVPTYTDRVEDLEGLHNFINTLSNVEKVDVLPYHKMGEYKWEQLGLENKLTHLAPPTDGEVEAAYERICGKKIVNI
ncbi:pyruvate formate lyase-activating protein [Bacillus shivajii]|uniref:pyruvate formate-lyase-activating protein n=1 Tax=Bacillus shivajii TaxID=1983719 RepID=UPI001CFAF454|nr:pyruvate formate-lyase-activating protein [Bacillus shivajii]UCZ52416.1 pyruvate formate lyase-activating protein [Bacillus shivajii]